MRGLVRRLPETNLASMYILLSDTRQPALSHDCQTHSIVCQIVAVHAASAFNLNRFAFTFFPSDPAVVTFHSYLAEVHH